MIRLVRLYAKYIKYLTVALVLFISAKEVYADNNSPLCFTAKNGSVTVRFYIFAPSNHPMQYSRDSTYWWTYTSNTSFTLNANEKLYFRAPSNQLTAQRFGTAYEGFSSRFYCTSSNGGTVECSGNIMSLYGPDCPDLPLQSNAFSHLFNGCRIITTAPSLSATVLAESCYSDMFYGCTSLSTAPSLPSTVLAKNCYGGMFYGCSSLSSAPSLPATSLAEECYVGMFRNCTSLVTAPSLPATTLSKGCYMGMFIDCSSLTTVPSLPATTLADSCYLNMFYGCTSLTSTPAFLPATFLPTWCYGYMFKRCTSLSTSPAISATALSSSCCCGMFENCTFLTSAPTTLPADTMANFCYSEMFKGCVSLAIAPTLPATVMALGCYESMFEGCTALTTAPSILPANTLAQKCYLRMFKDCFSLVSAPVLSATTLANRCYSDMFNQCTSLIAAPNLIATTLADECYSGMFNGCSSLTTSPELPADTLNTACYSLMFSGCSSLTTPPELPATSLTNSCYSDMFLNCTSLIVNTTGPGKEWVIQTTSTDSTSLTDMFVGTSGTMNSTPSVNTTYYIASVLHNVNVDVNDSTMGTVTGGGSYVYGSSATLTAVANHNYYFVSWSNGKTTSTITVPVFGDTILTAEFALCQTHLITEAETICQGETYSWHNKSLTTAGTYHDSLHSVYGCDSVYELTLTVNPTYLIPEQHSICQGETYSWHNQSLTTAGVYYDSLQSVYGCDSVYELTLTVNPTYFIPEQHSICQGETYTLHNKSLTAAGVYYDSLHSVYGCDSVYELTLTVNPTYFIPEQHSICQGETYSWHNKSLTTAGVYYDSLQSVYGCDSVYELTFTVNLTYFIPEQHSICQGETYSWHHKSLTTAGVYYDSLHSVYGCDSVCELTLTVNPTYFIPEQHSICQGETYSWHYKSLTAAGVYYDSLQSIYSCDSVYELTLTVNPTFFIPEQHSICQGETYSWHNKSLTTAGVYYDSLQSVNGCDSVYELTFTVNPTFLVEESAVLPSDGTGYQWHNNTYHEAGDYTDTLVTALGCDSICTLHLTGSEPSSVEGTRIITIKLVPNPIRTGEIAYIYADWTADEQQGMIVEILTTSGATVARMKPETFPIQISGITTQGTYMIRITTGDGVTYVRKLIVN